MGTSQDQASVERSEVVAVPGAHGRDRGSPVVLEFPSENQPAARMKREEDEDQGIPATDWFGSDGFQQVTHEGKLLTWRCSTASSWNALATSQFDQIVKIIEDPLASKPPIRNILITGNEGIGKSRFYIYCIFRLALDDAVRRLLPDFQLVLNHGSDYDVFDPDTQFFTPVTSTSEINKLRRNDQVVRLVEDDSDKLTRWSGISVFFPPPSHPKIRSFLKDYGQTFVMPTWSLNELRALNALQRPTSVDDATLVDRFTVCGGVPRSIFDTDPTTYKFALSQEIRRYRQRKPIDVVRGAETMRDDPTGSIIFEMVPTRPDFRTEYRVEFLSKHISASVVSHLEKDNSEVVYGFFSTQYRNEDSMTLAVADMMFEMLYLGKIEDRDIRFQPLTQEATTTTLKGGVIHSADADVVELETLDELEATAIPLDTFFELNDKSFVSAFILTKDEMMTTCYGLKMTIKAQPIDGHELAKFQAFLKRLSITQFYFIFLMPKGLATQSPVQLLPSEGEWTPIDQYVAAFGVAPTYFYYGSSPEAA